MKKLSLLINDKWLACIMFMIRHRYFPNFSKPRSLNEKINYIKLFNRNPLRKEIVDRLKVRDYVKKKSADVKLPNLLWKGVDFNQNVWEKLPNKFVIKANHGSKMTLVVDKNRKNFDSCNIEVQSWLDKDYSKIGREWMYKGLDKYLIVEEMLSVDGEVPPDFKFFVLSGRVEIVQVDLARFSSQRRNLYTREFKKMDATLFYDDTTDIDKPSCYEIGLQIAEELAVDLDFIRVDLYLLNDDVYFGELTNTPGNGFERFKPKSLDFELGAKLPSAIKR